MKAIVCAAYGPPEVLKLEEVQKPSPKEGRLEPVIDRSFRLEEAAEAHRYAETEHKKGNIVLAAAD